MPVNPSPTQINVLGIIRKNKRRRICCIILSHQFMLFSQNCNITRKTGYPIIKTGFICMPRIENHNSPVRQYQKSRIIMIIRLKVRTNQHFFSFTRQEIILYGFNIPVHIYIPNITSVYISRWTFIMNSTRISKPTPSPFICHTFSFIYRSTIRNPLRISS